MADGILPLSPASPGGQIEDVEQLNIVPPAPPAPAPGDISVVRQRVQTVGRLYAQIAEVLGTSPAVGDFGLVTRPLTPQIAVAPSLAQVLAGVVAVPLLVANANRKMATFQTQFISGGSTLFLRLGAGATTVLYTVELVPGAYYELPEPIYTGLIEGVWDGAVGFVNVSEYV